MSLSKEELSMKRMKKLMSCLLAIAMILSLGVTALADEKTDYVTAEDQLTGTTTNEGAMEANKISIILPTTTSGMYNMKLDPHDLISRTNAGRYSDKTFDFAADSSGNPTQKLFFLTNATVASAEAATKKNYTKDSSPLTIINKGMDDIDVTVTLEVDTKDQDFDFVAADALDNSSETAQMYLAVVSGSKTEAVTAPAADAEGTPFAPSATITSKGPTINGTAYEFLKAVELTITDEARLTDTVNAALSTLVFNVNYDASNGPITATSTGGTGLGVTDLPTATTGENVLSGADDVGDVTFTAQLDDGNEYFATVKFTIDTSVTSTIQSGATNAASAKLAGGGVKAPVSQAVLVTTVAGSAAAFKEEWNSTSEKYLWTRLPTTSGGSIAGVSFNDADYKEMSFNLTGNINAAAAWDTLSLTDDDTIGLTVIWKAEKSSGTADNSGSGSGSATTNADPTVALKGSQISSAAAVTYTVTYGSGTGEKAKVNRIYCTRSGATNAMTLSFNSDKSEVTFTPSNLQFNNGTDWKIEFTDEDGSNAKTLDLPAFKA